MILKHIPDDFVVREQVSVPVSSGTDQTYFWLTKKNWTTEAAIRIVAKKLGISTRRLKFAGTKDRRAITTQIVSAFKITPEQLLKLAIKDISIEIAGTGDEPTSLGCLQGNAFTITLRDISSEELADAEGKIATVRLGVVNYFGRQRFGRGNTHLIGRAILRGDIEDAARELLCFCSAGESEDITLFRAQMLKQWGNWEIAVPHLLYLESRVVRWLQQNPTDFAGALRTLPKHIRKLYVHAYQSHLWNAVVQSLSEIPPEVPLPGTATDWTTPTAQRFIPLLAQDGLSPECFSCPRMPELALTGEMRLAQVIPQDLSCSEPFPDECFPGKQKITLTFSLPRGCYATVVIDALQ